VMMNNINALRTGRHFLRTLIVLLLSGALPAAKGKGSDPANKITLTHRERYLQPGELVVMEARTPQGVTRLAASVFGREFLFFSEGGDMTWTGLIGIDLDTRPGEYIVRLQGDGDDGKSVTGEDRLTIAAKEFPTRRLTVDERFVKPPAEVLERIKKEAERVRAVLDSVTPERLWRGLFYAPVPGPPISSFGKRSVYNGQPRSAHAGTDFRGATGTPVQAPNAGRVTLAASLYYSGNTVILDHGLGLYSYFGHLSSISVKEGTKVEGGELIGKVGATGLVTGPHLHYSVRVAGSRVDPMSLLSLLGKQATSQTP
jgi:murein DD-endopeptidase MepM/ murein hydrolase activator NlpD